jgi:Ca2+-binding RTX toxin-like protein
MKHSRWYVAALALVLSACVVPAEEEEKAGVYDDEAEAFLMHGGGGGAPVWGVDPCEHPAKYAEDHGFNLIVMTDHKQVGTKYRDLIVGTNGDDEIWGDDGDDIICGGYGEDTIHGGEGDDYIDGGGDNDKLYGNAGNDTIHGRGGGDHIWGGAGNDLLFGDILDDHLYGEEGDDLLIGGHGTDVLMGGPGDDYLRGDTGNDAFIGGEGKDVASFATAMPPGQGVKVGDEPRHVNGVKIDFSNDCHESGFDPGDIGGKKVHDGCANGDGGNEPLDGIEIVVGSAYNDEFISNGQPRSFFSLYGADICDGKACGTKVPEEANGKVIVGVFAASRDSGVFVIGRNESDNLEIVAKDQVLRIRSKEGTPIFAGPGCMDGAEGSVMCPVLHTLRYVAAYMGDGNDVLKLGNNMNDHERFPRDFTAHASGGPGNDWLHGGDEEDVLFTGETGADHLFGNGGDDALLSESRKWPKKDCSAMSEADRLKNARCFENKPLGKDYEDGRDELWGGPGDDQLVADYPCGNHLFSGGGGKDVAGFARSGRFDITAQLAGAAAVSKEFHGRAFNPALCADTWRADATHFQDDDLEILEAADGDDELWGNDKPNVIWGREGDDRIHGLGGDDVLDGLRGDDWMFGGAGNDTFHGASGADHQFQDAN